MIRGAAALALVSTLLVMWLMAAGMGGGLSALFDPEVQSAALVDTAFGRTWAARAVLGLVLVGLSLSRRGPEGLAMPIGSGLLLASVAVTGHSALPDGPLGVLHRLADALHLLAAGWWIGGLLALVLAARQLGSDAGAVLARFSGVGYWAVAAILLTGLVKGALLVGSVPALVSTAYGWTLLAKVGLFAGMGALALANRFWITPGLERAGDPALWLRRLQGHVAVEFALGLAVLAVVGALGALSPPVSA